MGANNGYCGGGGGGGGAGGNGIEAVAFKIMACGLIFGDTDGDGRDGDDLAANEDGKGGGGGGGGTFVGIVGVDGFEVENCLSRRSFIVLLLGSVVLLLGSESDDKDLYICTFLLLKCISETGYFEVPANFAMAKKSVSILDASSPIPLLPDAIGTNVLVDVIPPADRVFGVDVPKNVTNEGADDELCRASFFPPSSTATVAFERADNLGI